MWRDQHPACYCYTLPMGPVMHVSEYFKWLRIRSNAKHINGALWPWTTISQAHYCVIYALNLQQMAGKSGQTLLLSFIILSGSQFKRQEHPQNSYSTWGNRTRGCKRHRLRCTLKECIMLMGRMLQLEGMQVWILSGALLCLQQHINIPLA